ncbi:hypothetical protein LPJ73_000351 [Coemansia sp. RSA 2703]|nr:hypothetical protein LPJ73_000351 [Coemansia sp. RSA 2703]KAJ2378594.1 hypothetical protein IW150_000702 [Coemansia sp. RSA 2607]KAJ2396725.1 hypothetical protein GGI05_000992 [Coemansia sp. RSA 2603]
MSDDQFVRNQLAALGIDAQTLLRLVTQSVQPNQQAAPSESEAGTNAGEGSEVGVRTSQAVDHQVWTPAGSPRASQSSTMSTGTVSSEEEDESSDASGSDDEWIPTLNAKVFNKTFEFCAAAKLDVEKQLSMLPAFRTKISRFSLGAMEGIVAAAGVPGLHQLRRENDGIALHGILGVYILQLALALHAGTDSANRRNQLDALVRLATLSCKQAVTAVGIHTNKIVDAINGKIPQFKALIQPDESKIETRMLHDKQTIAQLVALSQQREVVVAAAKAAASAKPSPSGQSKGFWNGKRGSKGKNKGNQSGGQRHQSQGQPKQSQPKSSQDKGLSDKQ